MTISEYAQVAEIFGVAIVAVTLIYLAVQVRQGATLLRSEARQAQIANELQLMFAVLGNPDLNEITRTTERIEFQDNARLHLWLVAMMRAREHDWLQYRAGVMGDQEWHAYRAVITVVLGTPRARKHWKIMRPSMAQDFVEMVDQLLVETPHTNLWQELEKIG